MFWKRKAAGKGEISSSATFEAAKEATRRAAFLNTAQGMTADEAYKQQLRELFLTCRSAALEAGAAEGHSEADVDAAIAALCDADTVHLRDASDEDFREFARDSGEIVKRFLSGR